MLIAKLTISYDRGLSHNDKDDLGSKDIFGRGTKTVDGKIIRGLGTHFTSQEEKDAVEARDKIAGRIRNEFKKRFLATPLDGVFVVPEAGVAKRFISGMEVPPDMSVRVTEFELSSPQALDEKEVHAWSQRIRNQLSGVSLGRSGAADEEGLRALEYLSSCPVLSKSTGNRIKELVAMVREGMMTRVEIKRGLEVLEIEIEQAPLAPRRSPQLQEA